MSSIRLCLVAFATFTLSVLTAVAYAQTTTVLNTLDLERLVASPAPDDHRRVSEHFASLADRYTTEADLHVQMAAGYSRNPFAKLGTEMAEHCRRLASLDRQLASELRRLATEHHQVAGKAEPGAAGLTAPSTGSPAPNELDLQRLAATAETAADHAALQRYFSGLQTSYAMQASEHRRLSLYYTGIKARTEAAHCERLARLAREAADVARHAADRHVQRATPGVTTQNQIPDGTIGTAASAVSRNDHVAVAAGFRAEEVRAAAEAHEHARLASYFRMSKLFSESVHCEREAGQARQASAEAASAAMAHEAAASPSR